MTALADLRNLESSVKMKGTQKTGVFRANKVEQEEEEHMNKVFYWTKIGLFGDVQQQEVLKWTLSVVQSPKMLSHMHCQIERGPEIT